MPTLLHLDSSARTGISGIDPYGSHTRRLSSRFVQNWRHQNPAGKVIYRDVGVTPPSHITGKWVHAAFTPATTREPWMNELLAESNLLISELLEADLIVAGVPMYNFGPPAQFKAYIDNIIRVGLTFGFDRTRLGAPYWPLLNQLNKQLVLLSSRGDFGYDTDEHMVARNHVESSIFTAFAYIGITQTWQIAIEYDEFADDRLAESILHAEIAVDRLVVQMVG